MAAAEITGADLDLHDLQRLIGDHIPPAVEKTRQYQTLQALVNCTRLSLLPENTESADVAELRHNWGLEIRRLEAEGIG